MMHTADNGAQQPNSKHFESFYNWWSTVAGSYVATVFSIPMKSYLSISVTLNDLLRRTLQIKG